MVHYNYETQFLLANEERYSNWISKIITSEGRELGEIAYIFCDDDYLHNINMKYLNHDTFTDIISFDYSEGNLIQGDIFISITRVKDNSLMFSSHFDTELLRVMAHGLLHYCGYKDKTDKEKALMRVKEDEKIKMFHVEH